MNKEEITKTLINNIKLNINEQNVYEVGLCVEQWKQILDYIDKLQQENEQLKESRDKAIELEEEIMYLANKSLIITQNVEVKAIRDRLENIFEILKGE